jgi:hypothetical protein
MVDDKGDRFARPGTAKDFALESTGLLSES